MSNEWGLIGRGFAIAFLGASASMSYIVGLSAIFIGQFTLASILLIAAVAGAVGFHIFVGRYLDVLDQRTGCTMGAMNKHISRPSGWESIGADQAM